MWGGVGAAQASAGSRPGLLGHSHLTAGGSRARGGRGGQRAAGAGSTGPLTLSLPPPPRITERMGWI